MHRSTGLVERGRAIPLVLGSLVSTVKGRVPKYYPCVAGFAIIVAGARTTAMNWRFYQLGTSAWAAYMGYLFCRARRHEVADAHLRDTRLAQPQPGPSQGLYWKRIQW